MIWDSPSTVNPRVATEPFKEFPSSTTGRRGLCSDCGSALTWRDENFAEKVEILVGTIDEVHLIGNRTARVKSKSLAEKGEWEEMLKEERITHQGLAKELCVPSKGNFFFRNAVEGVTDMKIGGKRFVEDSALGLVIPD